ncbi:MAG: serine protease [Syntrophobacterales bacterium]|nr:serine protease [Syntrophobacterales bacterium]
MNVLSMISLLCSVLFLLILPLPGHALTPDQVFDKVKDSVVVVKTLDSEGEVKSQGSGVMLPSGKIATNCHVVEGGASYQVGRGKQLVRATLYAEDKDKDICLLDAKGIKGKLAELGKAANLKVGVPVYAVGAPKGLELSLSDGIVSQLRGGPPPFIQTTAAISPGSSGGGLFDREGRLVGLTTLYVEGGQNLNFAMPVEWIGEIKPGRKTVSEGRSQTEWLKRAIALEKLMDWQELLDWCLKWTKIEPKNAGAWYVLGLAYYHIKRHRDAVNAYRQAVLIDPENADAWNNLGATYGILGRYNDAIDASRQAVRIDPENAGAWNVLGIAYKILERYNDALEAFRQAIHIDPDDAVKWNDIGNAYGLLKRYNDALDAFRQSIRIDPEDAGAWAGLGWAYAHLERYNDAIDAYRQSIRIDPENADAWGGLGGAYFFSGNRSAALDAVQKLRRLDPEKADILFNVIVPR